MKLFIDANILISVLNKEYPLFSITSRILSLADNRRFQLFTSPVCLAIAFYFSEKKSGNVEAKNKIRMLVNKMSIANHRKENIMESLENRRIYDFEDGLEYYAALDAGCNCIVTEDVKDFYFSEIEVCTAEFFLMKYVIAKNP